VFFPFDKKLHSYKHNTSSYYIILYAPSQDFSKGTFLQRKLFEKSFLCTPSKTLLKEETGLLPCVSTAANLLYATANFSVDNTVIICYNTK
jgi:hypothetical protein